MTTLKTFRFALTFTAMLLTVQYVPAQFISVRASVGAVDLPLSDWSKFFGEVQNAYYVKNNPNLYYAVSLFYPVAPNHSVSLGTELIRTSASVSNPAFFIDWKFQAIPVTVGYEYRIMTFNEHFTPVAGAGISYFFSDLTAKDHLFNHMSEQTGKGYGLHASLALISQLTKSLDLSVQARYRYSDGMAFTQKEGDIKVQFSGFDVSVGLGWNFPTD